MDIETIEVEDKEEQETSEAGQEESQQEKELEIKRLQAQLEKQKLAMDKAAKEAAEYKKQLRAKKSTEEQEAEEARERQEAMEQELNELRKKSAVEAGADALAQALYGAEDPEAALDSIQKAWTAREKKLRLEYSKLPAPAGGDGTPSTTKEDLKNMNYRERVEFARKYPEAYQNLTK